MRRAISIFLAGALLGSPAVAGKEPRAPTEKWLVNFADAQCIAIRNYGSKEDPLFLTVKEPALGGVLQVMIVKLGRGTDSPEEVDGSVSLDGGPGIPTSFLYTTVRKAGTQAFSVNMPRALFARVINSKSFQVRAGYRLNEIFELSSMPALIRVLDDCASGLRQVWRVSDASVPNSKLKQKTTGTLEGIFSSDDYPTIAIYRNEIGSVRFVLLVDETGRVADCSVIQTSGIAALDTQSCALVSQRARFVPATDVNGRPVKSAVLQTVSWRLGI
jgi:TonB family protein